MASHKDQNGNTTRYSFNSLFLASGKTDALINAESYAYGANACLSQVTGRKCPQVRHPYDNLNRVTKVWFGATVANPTTMNAAGSRDQ